MSESVDLVADEENLPWYYRRNALAFGVDMALFHTAMSFIGSTTVLPSFLATLTDSEVVVGVASGISSGAWLLPQIFVASFVSRLSRKKPFIIRAVWASRPVLLLMALVVWLFGQGSPTVTLLVTLAGIAIFFAGDAVAAVPWFDLLGKALPIRRRGRVLGIGQMVGGVGGIVAGLAVRYVLGGQSPWGFPNNYAVLFATGGAIILVAGLPLFLIHEPEGEPPEKAPPPVREVLSSIPSILVGDRDFMRVVAVKLCVSFIGVAGAFYVLYATRRLGFSIEDTGFFVSAQVLGSMGAGLLLSLAQDRWGPLVHMRLIIVLAMLPPILALIAGPLSALTRGALTPLYLLIYFFLGLYMGGVSWPFFNWILEYAPKGRQAIYIGLINTLSALAMLAPTLGGWMARAVSYPATFALALAFGLIALILSGTVASTR